MLWKNMDLSKFKIAAAPFGGPVGEIFLSIFQFFHFSSQQVFCEMAAMIRDENKIVLVQKQSTKPLISLYTSSGRQMGTIQWDKGRIVGMGWTDSEQLVCVLDDGTVRIYSIHGEYTQFSLGRVRSLLVLSLKKFEWIDDLIFLRFFPSSFLLFFLSAGGKGARG